MTTSMNKRTHFFIKIYILHFILERVMFLLCVRDELETDCYFDPSSSSLIAALLPHLSGGCSTVGHWGPKALCLPLALTPASCLQLTQAACVLVILLFNIHLLPLFFRLFTLVRLLIDGSVEGQYVMSWNGSFLFKTHVLCFICIQANVSRCLP